MPDSDRTQAIYENPLKWVLVSVLVGFVGIGGALKFWRISAPITAFFACGALFLWACAAVLWLRRKVPLCIFTEQGLTCPGLAQPIPWAVIRDYEVSLVGKADNTRLRLFLREDIEPPPLPGNWRNWGRVMYGPFDKHQLAFLAFDLRGMSVDELDACFKAWWQAGSARAQLVQKSK